MNTPQKPQNINLGQYHVLLNELSDEGLAHIRKMMDDMVPEPYFNASTLYSIILHIAAKAICTLCDEDQEARKKDADFFCERLSKFVKEATVLETSH